MDIFLNKRYIGIKNKVKYKRNKNSMMSETNTASSYFIREIRL